MNTNILWKLIEELEATSKLMVTLEQELFIKLLKEYHATEAIEFFVNNGFPDYIICGTSLYNYLAPVFKNLKFRTGLTLTSYQIEFCFSQDDDSGPYYYKLRNFLNE